MAAKSEKKQSDDEEWGSFKLEEGFRCQPSHIYEALTNEGMVSAYTRAPARIERKVGGKFSQFGGSIEGTFTELVPDKTIAMQWRFKDWAPDVYSNVTISLSAPGSSTCKVELSHSHIPERDGFGNRNQLQKCQDGWQKFYWDGIQKLMGYHKVPLDDLDD